MAKSKDNVVTHGLTGKVGNLLQFSQRAGKTIVGKIPDRSGVVPTDKQVEVMEKFQDGVVYAKSAIADPATKATYEAFAVEGITAFNLALADYCVAPQVKTLDVTNYAGVIGNKITVKATDNFMVKTVKVSIKKADDTLIEEGDAVQDVTNALLWDYTVTAANATVSGTKIAATATDLPGNSTAKDTIMP